MRFCDLFISYKIGLKGIKSTIPFTKLPLYRKIFVIILFACAIISAILSIFKLASIALILLGICVISFIVFLVINSTKGNLQIMLNDHYEPYSQKRMTMIIDVLDKYKIDIHNIESLDMLIEEAKQEQLHCDYLQPLKKPIKTLGAIIIPIIVFVAQKIGDAATLDETITIAAEAITLILLFSSLIFLLIPSFKNLLYRDYNKYNEFIYDIRQLKLFYISKENSSETAEE